MKRTIAVLLLAFMLLAGQVPAALAQQQTVSVLVDGLPLALDVPPLIENGRTLVPFRAIAEAMNINVEWDDRTRTVAASDGVTAVRLQIDNRVAYKDNIPITLDAAPCIVQGRTLIPLRFFSEAYACQVDWSATAYRATISTPPQTMTVIGFYALGDSQTSSWTDLFGQPYPMTGSGHTDMVSELALGWYSIDRQGHLLDQSRTGWQRPAGWQNVLDSAQKYNMRTEMVIHVTDADGAITALLNDPAAMKRAARAISAEAGQYHGVNLDFEGLGFNDWGEQLEQVQKGFTNFVTILKRELETGNIGLTLTLHPPNSAYLGYDYQTLGQIADRVIIMAYDYGAKPEPVNKVIQAVEAALASVPADRLILGISAPSETAASIAAKTGIAKRYRLGGVALWRLGVIDAGMWQALRGSITAQKS